jgi:murein DD-endopeptidase MepM/ murein hydrolase activator NlpD
MRTPKLLASPGRRFNFPTGFSWLLIAALALSACQPVGLSQLPAEPVAAEGQDELSAAAPTLQGSPTPLFPTRPRYAPGELVDYIAQTGDTLPGLAVRFNTTVQEIRAANPFIPASATTMPPGMPMKIPIYYLPLWGSPYQILPDSLFVNGPAQIDFDTQAYVASQPGWLKNYKSYVADANRSGAEIVEYIAHYYSISPRLLLALLEHQAHALSEPEASKDIEEFPLGHRRWNYKGLFLQLAYAANQLNEGYYAYRTQKLTYLEHQDGTIERIDPWQNAATVSLMRYFNSLYSYDQYSAAISPAGFIQTYRRLFGDPWQNVQPHLPGSLEQPAFLLPFEPGDVWALTGGPHAAWGTGAPLAALDFAPPSKSAGCVYSDRWATAVADGVVVRSEEGQVMLDLDGDGDERTGWNVFYLHVGSEGRVPLGAVVKQGDRIGHPSCEGGSATGTHIHIARKYNGEWMPAEGIGNGILAFNLEGWVARNGSQPYLGTLVRNALVVTACTCSNAASWIQSDRKPLEARQNTP